jgi:hypothetical protein
MLNLIYSKQIISKAGPENLGESDPDFQYGGKVQAYRVGLRYSRETDMVEGLA